MKAPESVALDRPPHELEMLDCPAVSDFTNPCAENGGICVTTADGYSIQLVLCTCLGILWLIMFAKKILQLEVIICVFVYVCIFYSICCQ